MKNLIFFFLFFFFICTNKLFANFKPTIFTENSENSELSGYIKDSLTNKPLIGVSIYIRDLKSGVVTDRNGFYVFKNIPAGKYLTEIKYEGYRDKNLYLYIKGETNFNCGLIESVTVMNEVVVTGSSKATFIKKNPIPIISISHDYLVSNASTNAIDAISNVPGIRAVTSGPNVSKPFIRGLGFNRILTLYNDNRQEGQQWGDEHGIEVDQYAINHVEVIKGPASLSYGSDALAGVINLIPTPPAPEGKSIGNFVAEYQSNNNLIGNSIFYSSTKNGNEWLVRFSNKMAQNYQNAVDGKVYGTAFNETDFNASFGLHRKWGYSHIDFIGYNNSQEVPDGSRDPETWKFTKQISEIDTLRPIVPDNELNTYTIKTIRQRIQHYRIFWGNKLSFSNGSDLIANFGLQRSMREEFNHPELPNLAGLVLQLNTFTYDLKYSLPELNGWYLNPGVNGLFQDNDVLKGTEFIIPNYQQYDLGAFINIKKNFNKLDIAGGIRYDLRNFQSDALYTKTNPVTGFDMPVFGNDITEDASNPFKSYIHTFKGISWSVGATYNFSEKFTLKFNVSRGYRAPNISEISSNGVHPGTNFYQIGNTNFEPEQSLQQDFGLIYTSANHNLRIELNVFNNRIDNYIFNQKLQSLSGGDSVIPGSEVEQTFKFLSTSANLYGGEFRLDFSPVKGLHINNSFSVVYAENLGTNSIALPDSQKYLPFIPPVHGITELKLDFNSRKLHIKNGYIKTQMEYFANQDRVFSAYETETRTPGYTLFNFGIGASFVNNAKKIICNLHFNINNIFDITYWDHLSRLKYFTNDKADPREHGIYNIGRNMAIRIDFPF